MNAALARALNLLVWFVCLVPVLSVIAEEVPVRHPEGRIHGFLVLRDLDDRLLASGASIRYANGSRVTNELGPVAFS